MVTSPPKLLAGACLGNFLGSLGGGLLLAKGLNLSRHLPGAWGDSVLTYLVGSIFSSAAIIALRRSHKNVIWRVSGLGVIVVILLLAVIEVAAAIQPKLHALAMFLLLSSYFALTSIPRALRSDLAAGTQGGLPWSELSYSAGYLAGLLMIRWLDSISDTLFVCLLLAIATTISDAFLAPRLRSALPEAAATTSPRSVVPILQFIVMTLGVQVLIQGYSSLREATAPLAAFEVGVTLALLFFSVCNVKFRPSVGLRFGGVSISNFARTLPTGPSFVTVIALGVVGVILYESNNFYFSLLLLLLASAGYESLSVVLLSQIGSTPGAVATAFATNGLACSVVYALVRGSLGGLLLCAGGALLLAIFSFLIEPRLRVSEDVEG